MKPFFARFLENQNTLNREDMTQLVGGGDKGNDNKRTTMKYPSDTDEA